MSEVKTINFKFSPYLQNIVLVCLSIVYSGIFQDTSVDLEDGMSKSKHQDNPFIEPMQQQAVVDMKGKLYYTVYDLGNLGSGPPLCCWLITNLVTDA